MLRNHRLKHVAMVHQTKRTRTTLAPAKLPLPLGKSESPTDCLSSLHLISIYDATRIQYAAITPPNSWAVRVADTYNLPKPVKTGCCCQPSKSTSRMPNWHQIFHTLYLLRLRTNGTHDVHVLSAIMHPVVRTLLSLRVQSSARATG